MGMGVLLFSKEELVANVAMEPGEGHIAKAKAGNVVESDRDCKPQKTICRTDGIAFAHSAMSQVSLESTNAEVSQALFNQETLLSDYRVGIRLVWCDGDESHQPR